MGLFKSIFNPIGSITNKVFGGGGSFTDPVGSMMSKSFGGGGASPVNTGMLAKQDEKRARKALDKGMRQGRQFGENIMGSTIGEVGAGRRDYLGKLQERASEPSMRAQAMRIAQGDEMRKMAGAQRRMGMANSPASLGQIYEQATKGNLLASTIEQQDRYGAEDQLNRELAARGAGIASQRAAGGQLRLATTRTTPVVQPSGGGGLFGGLFG
jgi:hypothetical protein